MAMTPKTTLFTPVLRFALWATLPATLGLGAFAMVASPKANLVQARPAAQTPKPAAKVLPQKAKAVTNRSEAVRFDVPNGRKVYALKAGEIVEISVRLLKPSQLPTNGRVEVVWSLENAPTTLATVPNSRTETAFGIYTRPTANWRKVLHAHDSDIYLTYRAPIAGKYVLSVRPVTDEEWVGAQTVRWRERGSVPQLNSLPRVTPWPEGAKAPLEISVRPLDIRGSLERAEKTLQTHIEFEPNDTPEMAQTIALTPAEGDAVKTWEITGGADDIEFFDNGKVGASGDDWFRIEYKGTEPRLLTAQISMPGQFLLSRIRAYRLNVPAGQPAPKGGLGTLLPVVETKDGQDPNERVHQQDEEHRANVCRLLKPGETYFLRVEANTPGYQLQLRLVKPAPYADPRMAVRQAMYTQVGQVDSWLTNRPRGASIERRIRDSGNLLGTQCMSCHTQSGVWGPSVPIQNGYRVENPQNYWHMVNVMYECLRPCNELKDAVNNTSLAPLDIGDGPAGTRAAGFNIVNLERIRKPSKLHSRQQIRTANYVLQTADPGGINAAGPGSNIGFVIVNLFSTEILKTAWEASGDPKYFRGMEAKAKNVLEVVPAFVDDVAIRLDYFNRVFPIKKYNDWAQKADTQERARAQKTTDRIAEREAFVAQVLAKLKEDETRLRALQTESGAWGFHPGALKEDGKTWRIVDTNTDPSPTALGITALTSAGYGKDDPAVVKGVKALLAMQEPTGRWNRAAQTGFVTTAYALHALSRLYPNPKTVLRRNDFAPVPDENLLATIKRVQALALAKAPQFNDLLLAEAKDNSPQVRYWAMIGLGTNPSDKHIPALIAALGDPAKMVRNAATWAMRENLLDDRGWDALFAAFEKGNDTTREQVAQVLNMRADGVTTQAKVGWTRLNAFWDRAMNRDPHPAVRSWASKAAWQWWVWNAPVRNSVNVAWVKMLERPESDAVTENALRYSSQALFIANGHKANGSSEHQYKELAALFETLAKRLDSLKDVETKRRLAQRLITVGGTFYETAGGDGGPGQMGYVTPNSGDMMGKAALIYLEEKTTQASLDAIRAGIEGGANVPYQPLNKYLVDYSLKGPEELRQIAAAAVSDPRSVSLQAVPEQVEPQMVQVKRGAAEPLRRAQVSDPIISLWARVNWIIPKTEEQQRNFFNIMIPQFPTYASPQEMAQMQDAAKRASLEREMSAAWYLADKLGEVLERNPDMHQEIVFRRYFPDKFQNALEEHFWLRSVEWLLTFNPTMTPPVGAKTAAFQTPNPKDAPDIALSIKDRALQLFLDALKPTANPQTRAIAIRMSNKTALRVNPEVGRALAEALRFEKDKELRQIIENVLSQSSAKFMPDLLTALKEEKHASVRFTPQGEPQLSKQQTDDIVYFRDYVMPELSRQKRLDQQSCMGCHGVVGRVPSFYMKPPDKFGYIPVSDLLFDYRVMQSKVRLDNIERSKILRKPLNIQDGKEDGHQGGRRYTPNDEGYLMLKRWAENQAKVLQPAATALAPKILPNAVELGLPPRFPTR